MLEFEVHYDAVDYDGLHPHKLFAPVSAVQNLPEWFKNIPSTVDDKKTVKNCRGVWDIISSGYLILWPFDATIFKNEHGRLDIVQTRSENKDSFHPHPHFQLDGYPDLNLFKQESGVQKLKVPYRIKTPPGTSILMMQPQYRPELKTDIATGIIDTDDYYGDFNILFTIKNFEGNRKKVIKAGTPLAQIVPFVRGEWNLKFDKINQEEAKSNQEFASNIDKFYQRYMWKRKVY